MVSSLFVGTENELERSFFPGVSHGEGGVTKRGVDPLPTNDISSVRNSHSLDI